MRVVIDFTDEQTSVLKRVTDRDNISRNEAVRRAVEQCYGTSSSAMTREQLFNRMIGLWREREIDADGFVNAIRGEWDHDLPTLQPRSASPAPNPRAKQSRRTEHTDPQRSGTTTR